MIQHTQYGNVNFCTGKNGRNGKTFATFATSASAFFSILDQRSGLVCPDYPVSFPSLPTIFSNIMFEN